MVFKQADGILLTASVQAILQAQWRRLIRVVLLFFMRKLFSYLQNFAVENLQFVVEHAVNSHNFPFTKSKINADKLFEMKICVAFEFNFNDNYYCYYC